MQVDDVDHKGGVAYRVQDVRELDRQAIELHNIPGLRLMSRAAHAAFDRLNFVWPGIQKLAVYCGTGNNGGDGYLIAALARQRGILTTVYELGNGEKIVGDALSAKSHALEVGVDIKAFDPAQPVDAEVIVDALLGTGLKRLVTGNYAAAIETINGCGLPVLCLDIPSGLSSDTGRVLGCAIRAAHTVTFIGLKQGLLTGQGPEYCGVIHYSDLAVPSEVFDAVAPSCFRLNLSELQNLLPPRSRDAHKGSNGRVLILGGDKGFGGAVIMASGAATRSGAGLVSVATQESNVSALLSRFPEVMARSVSSGQEINSLAAETDVIVIGPGLGQSSWSEQLMQVACDASKKMVVDADALNLLAEQPGYANIGKQRWILTPHPGEAARLLGISTAEVESDRFAAVRALQQRYGGVAILKGAGTLIADTENISISEYGNPGMATGGMGDVLSGILAALLAQGLSLVEAAKLGVCVHGSAADRAVLNGGEIGLLATDLLLPIRELLNGQ